MSSQKFWDGADKAMGFISAIVIVGVFVSLLVGSFYYAKKAEDLEARIQNSCMCLPEGED